MKTMYLLIFCGSILLSPKSRSQNRSYPFYELYQLDSIAQGNSIGRHFGALYFDFLSLVEKKLEKTDTLTTRLVRNFETVFARFFIDACAAYEKKKEIPLEAWSAYFSDSTLQPTQYHLLGANAHLNGGLAEAILNSYTDQEWEFIKPRYRLFNSCLNETLANVYEGSVHDNKRARLLSVLSLGMTQPLSRYYLYKWRRRQMRLTVYLFGRSPRYERLLNKIKRKKEKIDKLVLTQF
jgi:hypothetical protein